MIENYSLLDNGLIKQNKIVKNIQEYNKSYVDIRYNSYGEKGSQMAGIRLGYLIASIGRKPTSVLDVGYGNGDFLKVCSQGIKECYGNDISGYPVPEGTIFVDNIFEKKYDVICFFDSLEHFEDITFVKDLKCNYIYLSLPWCHYFSDEWFLNWKHRRIDEHLWHFNQISAEKFFNEMGYELVTFSNVEDIIRNNNENYENILTCIFKKK